MENAIYILLGVAGVLIVVMIIISYREKKKLRDARKRGEIDHYMLLAKFEKTVISIINLKQDDKEFAEEAKKIYLNEINNFIDEANLYIKDCIIPTQKKTLTPAEFIDMINAAIMFIKLSSNEGIKNQKYISSPTKYILEFNNEGKIVFDTEEFQKTVFNPIEERKNENAEDAKVL